MVDFLSSLKHILSKLPSFLTIKLWAIMITISFLLLIGILIFALVTWRYRRRLRKITMSRQENAQSISSMDKGMLLSSHNIEVSSGTLEKQAVCSDQVSSNKNNNKSSGSVGSYTLDEIEAATDGLAYEKVIGSGGCGVVLQGVLRDNTPVAIKKLFIDRREKTLFVKEVEAMQLIRHKNVVQLKGYCAESGYRMLVYEYVEKGTLEDWLHHCTSAVSPLTWKLRQLIIMGVAKGLAYLHEDSEPRVVHGNLKSGNILLDLQWNPKISDYGITKLMEHEWTRGSHPSGMSGYLASEYHKTRVFDEKSDVYSFGVLMLEIVSGKTATESPVSEIEEYLVDWIKCFVADERYDLILDPRLPEAPSLKELKRILLIALRCIDLHPPNRPKMGEVVHMLEPYGLLLSDETVKKRRIFRHC